MTQREINWLRDAYNLIFYYKRNEEIRERVNSTFIYNSRSVFFYVETLIRFSPNYFRYYKQIFQRDLTYFYSGKVRKVWKDILPNRLWAFFDKCEADKQEFERITNVLSSISPQASIYSEDELRRLYLADNLIQKQQRVDAFDRLLRAITRSKKKEEEVEETLEPKPVKKPTTPEETVEYLKKFIPEKKVGEKPTTPEETVEYLKNIQPKVSKPQTPEQTVDYLRSITQKSPGKPQTPEQTVDYLKSVKPTSAIQPQSLINETVKDISSKSQILISRSVTPFRVATLFSAGLGGVVGGSMAGVPGFLLGATVGASIPSVLTSQRADEGARTVDRVTDGALNALSKINALTNYIPQVRAAKVIIIAAIILAILLVLLPFNLLQSSSLLPPYEQGIAHAGPENFPIRPVGSACPDQSAINANKSSPETCRYFGLGVDIFDTNLPQSAIESYINKYSGRFKGGLDEFRVRVNYIVTKSKEVGINPVLALGYWKTESDFSNIGTRDLGCHPSAANFYEQVDCKLGINEFSDPVKNPISNCTRSRDANSSACRALKSIRRTLDINNPINYPIATFDDFAESYGSRDPGLDGPGKTNNNCKSTYNQLIEVAIELNACKVTAPPSIPPTPTTAVASCPVVGGTISTSSYQANPNQGHCGGRYRYSCKCDTTGRRAKAIDVSSGGKSVVLPQISNQDVIWRLITGPYNINDGEGGGFGYTFKATVGGDRWYLDMLHLNRSGLQSGVDYPSGTVVATTTISHVHATMGKNLSRDPVAGTNTDCDANWLPSDFMCQ